MKPIATEVNLTQLGDAYKLTGDMVELLSIDGDSLYHEVLIHAQGAARLGVLLAKAERKLADAKSLRKQLKAMTYKSLRDTGEKFTEKQLEAEIDSNPELLVLERQINDWDEAVNTLEKLCDAWKQRKDMLVSAAQMQRAAGEYTPTTVGDALSRSVAERKAKSRK